MSKDTPGLRAYRRLSPEQRKIRTASSVAARRAARAYTKDETVGQCGAEKSQRVDLGLAMLTEVYAVPGVSYTREEIAVWAGCSDGNIYNLERDALKMLRNRLQFMKDARLQEAVEGLFFDRRPAARKEVANG